MTHPVLDIMKVTKSFPSEGNYRTILEDINFQVEDLPDRGELVALVGPSGCGKTTLLNLIAGLTQPSAGMVSIKGQMVTEPGRDKAFVFQSHSEFPWRTVGDNVTMGLEFEGESRGNRRTCASHWLERVGLAGSEDRYPRQLSGGMRQRLALARALCQNPSVILMDEPFGALDVRIRLDMQDLLRSVWSRAPNTIVLVTHDMTEAVYLADQVVVMAPDPGRIVEVVSVPFGVHRDRSIEGTKPFKEIVEHVTSLVRGVARKV